MSASYAADNRHRFTALALLFLVLGAGYWLIDRIWIDKYLFYKNNIAAQQDQLQRYNNILALRGDLEARLQQIKQDDSIDAFYLQQTASMLAATDLQQRVKSAVESSGGKLVSTQVLPVVDEEGFSKVSIRVQLTGDTPSLQKALYELETARPLLFIDGLQIRRQPIRQRNPNDRKRSKIKIQLTIQFELSGYIHRSEA